MIKKFDFILTLVIIIMIVLASLSIILPVFEVNPFLKVPTWDWQIGIA
jgi:hypothetical protein